MSYPMDDDDLQLFITGSPLNSKLTCPNHNQRLAYHCQETDCQVFLCNNTDCLDEHFHDGVLKLKKLDVIEVMEIFDEVKSAKKCNQFACSNLEELHDKFTLLKNSVNGVLANYSKFSTLTAEINEKPLQDSFITNVDTLVSLTKEMKVEMDNIKKHIWLQPQDLSKQWTNPSQIVGTLKHHFREFRKMSFRQVQLTEGEDGFAGVDHKDYRGFLLLYYSSSHGALIGEYFGRNMHALNNGYISITNYTKCIGFVFIVEANAVHQYYRNEKIPLHAMLHIDDKIRREPQQNDFESFFKFAKHYTTWNDPTVKLLKQEEDSNLYPVKIDQESDEMVDNFSWRTMDCFYLDCKLPGDQFYHTKDYYCVHESMLIDKVLSYELYEDLMMLDQS